MDGTVDVAALLPDDLWARFAGALPPADVSAQLPDDVAAILQCVVLSAASSLDNFAVGTSLGISAPKVGLSARMNLIVSLCNAVGAVLSSGLGALLGDLAPNAAAVFGASIFLWLGFGEVDSYVNDEPSPLATLAESGSPWRLAIPMTLNNLAGGVAGGLAGVGPATMGFGAVSASFGLMYIGHCIGKHSASALASSRFDPRVGAAVAFLGLGCMQFADLVGWLLSALIVAASLGSWHAWCYLAWPGKAPQHPDVVTSEGAAEGAPVETLGAPHGQLGSISETRAVMGSVPQQAPPPAPLPPASPMRTPRIPVRHFKKPKDFFSPTVTPRYPRAEQPTEFPGVHTKLRARRLLKLPPRESGGREGSLFCCVSR